MKPRILFISYARFIGGGEIYLANLLAKLGNKFSIVVLATRPVRKILRTKTAGFLLFPQLLEKTLPRTYRLRKIYYQLYFRLFFRLDKYQLICLQDFDGAMIEAIAQRPLVLTLLTDFLIPEKFNDSVRQRFEQIDKVICISQQTKKDLLRRGIASEKCVVIHNGIDPKEYSMNRQPGKYITWIGRVEEADKNPMLFVKLAQAAQTQNLPYKFRLVGSGSYLNKIRQYCQNKHIENLQLYGFCPHEKIQEMYAQANVVCLTSTSEGVPLVVLEAMACGVPVVATKVGGLPEIINSPKVGRLVDSFETKEFLDEITSLLSDEGLYRQVRENARHLIETDFSLNAMAEKTSQVYAKLLENKQ